MGMGTERRMGAEPQPLDAKSGKESGRRREKGHDFLS